MGKQKQKKNFWTRDFSSFFLFIHHHDFWFIHFFYSQKYSTHSYNSNDNQSQWNVLDFSFWPRFFSTRLGVCWNKKHAHEWVFVFVVFFLVWIVKPEKNCIMHARDYYRWIEIWFSGLLKKKYETREDDNDVKFDQNCRRH